MRNRASNGKMFSIEDFIIAAFCCVDDLWSQVTQGKRIRKGGFTPSLSDSEVITMEIVGEFLGIETDKGIWHYFRAHWLNLFPHIKSRTTFSRQASNLWSYKHSSRHSAREKEGSSGKATKDNPVSSLACFLAAK